MRQKRQYGHVRPPTAGQLQEYAGRHHWELTNDQAVSLEPVLAGMMLMFDTIDELQEPDIPPSPFATRSSGRAPSELEDPYNAFIRFCKVSGAGSGPLFGLTAAVKDSIAVAGVPMTNGSRMLPTLVPLEDAIAVERILQAGATIVGKTNLEDLAMGNGEGSAYGPTKNPLDHRFGTGGSSSGSGAAVAAGMVDFALGADEAGSVRIPSAWCGLVGMKATHGLVPSYGMSYMDHTLDHIGPMTRNVEMNARVLEAIAGSDWRDPQWVRRDAITDSYSSSIDLGVAGMRIGVIDEALEPSGCTPDVLEAFDKACNELTDAGAVIVPVSVPLWIHAWAIENTFLTFAARAMADSGGAGYGHKGRISVQSLEMVSTQYRTSASDIAILSRLNLLSAEHMRDQYLGVHYGKAQNLRIELTKQVQRALDGVDALVTPTVPTGATKLSEERFSLVGMIPRLTGVDVINNTCPLDLTGHPALTVPAGAGANGLPTGFQVIGNFFDERTVYRVGAAVESAGLWTAPDSPGPRIVID